ncbi:hypothetical protein Indivirus_3_27 [Indivirus ILV1]|uniref:Uncharacterized protein n=1 Tax=Indivirus ILV1 TaxID=1977633 RepID=A0A1V0SDP9_9VIRU|nr:hypothetical protein Indivirus_3_27 [Indivirus ILV1]
MYCDPDNKILLILILIIVVILTLLNIHQIIVPQNEKMENIELTNPSPISTQDPVLTQPPILITPTQPISDPIIEYDYRKIFDPLTDPTRRVPRHEIPTLPFKRLLDFPTRGFPDNYTQIGILKLYETCKHGREKKINLDNNSILRLFGRQEYPGSNRYEYYTAINNGFDQIKIPVRNRRKNELYDGDEIFIDELDRKYRVKLLKYDAPKYYPDIV